MSNSNTASRCYKTRLRRYVLMGQVVSIQHYMVSFRVWKKLNALDSYNKVD